MTSCAFAAAFAFAGIVAALSACSTSGDDGKGNGGKPIAEGGISPTETPVTKLFAPTVTDVEVEVDYAVDAEPFTGPAGQFRDVWQLFRSNALAVFDGKKTLTTPNHLGQMQKLEEVVATEFTDQDLLDLAATYRDEQPSEERATFYVVYLNGHYKNADGEVDDQMLSVSVPGSTVIGMFKPAIVASARKDGPLAGRIEQTALIHSFGHAVGFVDNGVPLADRNPHHDTDHGPHCTNPQCVMYWENEHRTKIADWVTSYVFSNEPIIYGQECLSDARILEDRQRNP